jgi:hypothetical protein
LSVVGTAAVTVLLSATLTGASPVVGTETTSIDHITIATTDSPIKAGKTATYTAEAWAGTTDQGPVTGSTNFTITMVKRSPGGSGTGTWSCTLNACMSQVAGDYLVTGTKDTLTAGTLTATANLHVDPAAFHQIKISPADATIKAGHMQKYTAGAYDQYGNDRGDDVTASTTFTITRITGAGGDGSCTNKKCGSDYVGDYKVTGTRPGSGGATPAGGANPNAVPASTNSTTLTVEPAALSYIVISPNPATIKAGKEKAYHAEGFDKYKNSRGNVTGSTVFTITGMGGAGSCDVNKCKSELAGSYQVTGTKTRTTDDGGDGEDVAADAVTTFTDTATLNVEAAAFDHLAIDPTESKIVAGNAQAYVTKAYDQYNNPLGDVTGSTAFSIDGSGSGCTTNACGSNVVGKYTVTATHNESTVTAILHVTAGAITRIVISPDPKTIPAGTTQAFTAEGFDAHGNSLGDVTASTIFSIDGVGSCSGAICGSPAGGAFTVTATLHVGDSTVTDTAALTVTPLATDAPPSPAPSVSAAPSTPAPTEVVEGATFSPVQVATPPVTSTGGDTPLGGGSGPMLIILISLLCGGLGLLAVRTQKRQTRS